MKNWIIVGACSAMAEAVAQRWAREGYALFLVARNAERLALVAADIETRGARQVATHLLDVNDLEAHAACYRAAQAALGKVDGILIAHGTLPDQRACEASVEMTLKEITTNGTSVVSLCSIAANDMAARGEGIIAVISSVAGDRGRQSNYVYGAAKGMVSTFLQGLRNRLFKSGVHVLTIKPGFVDTPMTADIEKGGPLWATPDQVADSIIKAINQQKDVAYVPWFWWGIMVIIKSIPEKIFKRLGL